MSSERLTDRERDALSMWDEGTYSCACTDDPCLVLPCQNERSDLYTEVERIIAARSRAVVCTNCEADEHACSGCGALGTLTVLAEHAPEVES